jgi:chromate transporter
MQPAVAALIIRAVHRIGTHALHNNKWLWSLAIFAAFAQFLDVNFLITLLICGFIFALITRGQTRFGFLLLVVSVFSIFYFNFNQFSTPQTIPNTQILETNSLTLFISGLRAGLLTFGGAYTAIPFIQHDAVEVGQWMTNAQFLDGLALSGLLPAPLIIFSTFVGYLGGGAIGAILMTIGVFAPAFSFTMIGHEYLEKLTENKSIHAFLDGITAGVIGLISVTAIYIFIETITNLPAFIIFSLALIVLFISKSKWIVAWVVLVAGLVGLLFF